MFDEPDQAVAADGVTVISAWTRSDGGLLIRVTMSGGDDDAEVKVFSRVDEAVEVLGQWLGGLAARSGQTT